MNKNRVYKAVLIGVVGLFIAMAAIASISYSQYKTRTLNYIIPGSDKLLADRFFASVSKVDTAMGGNDSAMAVIGLFPYKTKIRGAWYRQIGIDAAANDSMKIVMTTGQGLTIESDTLCADTLFLYGRGGTVGFDSTAKPFTFDSVGFSAIDTISRFDVISIKGFLGCVDSSADSLLLSGGLHNYNLTIEFEIIE